MKNNLITIGFADSNRFCRRCNFAGRDKKQTKPCNYHAHGESMNYRNIPPGMCALRQVDRDRMAGDYGVDRLGRLM